MQSNSNGGIASKIFMTMNVHSANRIPANQTLALSLSLCTRGNNNKKAATAYIYAVKKPRACTRV